MGENFLAKAEVGRPGGSRSRLERKGQLERTEV